MTYLAWILLALFAAPFWETTPPREWTDDELEDVLHASPWSAAANPEIRKMELKLGEDLNHVYICSAEPMILAEKEKWRRYPPSGEALEDDYALEHHDFLASNPGKYIMLAVYVKLPQYTRDKKEIQRLENDSVLVLGKKEYKIVGHFPPSPGDPYLRLVFPREVSEDDKMLLFDVYLPGVPEPYRQFRFGIKDLYYKGKLEL